MHIIEREPEDYIMLVIKRERAIVAFLNRIKVTVLDDNRNVIDCFKFRPGQEKAIGLPKQRYTVEMSFGKLVTNEVTIHGDMYSSVGITFRPANFNFLANLIPFMGFLVPAFELKADVSHFSDGGDEVQQSAAHTLVKPSILRRLAVIFLSVLTALLLFIGMAFYIDVMTGNQNVSSTPDVWAIEGTDAYALYSAEIVGQALGYPIFTVILFAVVCLLFSLIRKLRRKLRKCDEISKFSHVRPPFIVYLRSFNSDKDTLREIESFLMAGQTEEKALVAILDDIAPVITCGRPGEKYLPEGASRIYMADTEWKDRISDWVRRAELVVVRLGDTDGVWWEVNFCLSQISLDKLLFVIPTAKNSSMMADLHKLMVENGIETGDFPADNGKAAKGTISGFIYFSDNKPIFKKLKINKILSVFTPLESVMREMLQGFHKKFDTHRKLSLKARAALVWAGAAFLILTMTMSSIAAYLNLNNNRYPKEIIAYCSEDAELWDKISAYSDKGKVHRVFGYFISGSRLLDDEACLEMYNITTALYDSMSAREFEIMIESAPKNNYFEAQQTAYSEKVLVIAKKYLYAWAYDLYINHIREGALIYVQNMDKELPALMQVDSDTYAVLQERAEQIAEKYVLEDPEGFRKYIVELRGMILDMYEEGYDMMPMIRNSLIM